MTDTRETTLRPSIQSILTQHFVERGAVGNRETTLETLGADSLDLLELVMDAEDKFDIDLMHVDLSQIKTIGDYAALVEGALKEKKINA